MSGDAGRLLAGSPAEYVAWLREACGGRASFVQRRDGQSLRADPAAAELLVPFFKDPASGWAAHEGLFLQAGSSGALLAVFVHSTRRGQAQGGLRCRSYPTLEALLRDGLRLSRAMARKNALAGLWWGGGKGILAPRDADAAREPELRASLFREYGALVTSLRGLYVTAEDLGSRPADLAEVARVTRFVTCIPPEMGGSGNPSRHTAAGVVASMRAALAFRDMGTLEGKRVVIQGGGSVGLAVAEHVLDREVGEVVVGETSGARCQSLQSRFRGRPVRVRHVGAGDASILAERCDVLAPCAVGAVLDAETIPTLRTRIVCGAANNALADEERDARALLERGITFVPDFVANRLGIVHCANEQYGYPPEDATLASQLDPHFEGSIPATVTRLLLEAREEGISPLEAAHRLADLRVREPHPVWGDRARQILDGLVAEGWAGPRGRARGGAG